VSPEPVDGIGNGKSSGGNRLQQILDLFSVQPTSNGIHPAWLLSRVSPGRESQGGKCTAARF
jgi:hypothetical protein